jgi:hypothetical protein
MTSSTKVVEDGQRRCLNIKLSLTISGMGQARSFDIVRNIFALPPIATNERTSPEVRVVP